MRGERDAAVMLINVVPLVSIAAAKKTLSTITRENISDVQVIR